MGLHWAGFDVTGIDIKPQLRYPFRFIQGDAVAFCDEHGHEFDFIWASPLCQRHSSLAALHPSVKYACFISATRDSLQRSFRPWVMENVPGAPLINPVMLCGSSFGLQVRRHRLFESTFSIDPPDCDHETQPEPIDCSGTGSRRLGQRLDGKGGNSRKPLNLEQAREAMGIDWMNRYEISQAIPPAYAEFIARQFLSHHPEVS